MAELDRALRELAQRLLDGGLGRDEAKAALDRALAPMRGRGVTSTSLLRELGLVTRSEHEELELRVAQLEQRLRLLERARDEPRA
jgi:polyhydroxyalkanoate synthesis regulator phasin